MMEDERRLTERQQQLKEKHEQDLERKRQQEQTERERKEEEERRRREEQQAVLGQLAKEERESTAKKSRQQLLSEHKALQEREESVSKEREEEARLDEKIAQLRTQHLATTSSGERGAVSSADDSRAWEDEQKQWEAETSRFDERERQLDTEQRAMTSLEQCLDAFRRQVGDQRSRTSTPSNDLDELARREWQAQNSPQLVVRRRSVQMGGSGGSGPDSARPESPPLPRLISIWLLFPPGPVSFHKRNEHTARERSTRA